MIAVALLALLAPLAPGAASAQLSPVGLWQAVDDDTKQPNGWFLITDHGGGVYDGIIAKMFLKPGQDPNVVCGECKDDRHNHPWLGLEIIRGMKPDGDKGDKYADGTILDPRDGKVYKAMMTVTPDNQTLVVRGYLGYSLFGKNQYWTRLPDSAYSMLDPAINPNPATNAARPGAAGRPGSPSAPGTAGPARK
jgi:uncharacterized protein (DUF2147 family)